MKRGIFRGIHRVFFENFWWRVLALLIAIAIWALVASEPELSTFITVPVEFKNLPDDLEISSKPVTSVVLELRGPSGLLHSAGNEMRPSVVLDMSDARPGERTYAIAGGSVRLARGIHLVRAVPSEVRVSFEPRSIRTVPVEVRFEGEGENGYEPAQVRVTPPQVRIAGPRSQVARVTSAVTDRIDLSNVVGTEEFHVNVYVEDPYVRLVDSPEVTVQVAMKKKR